LVEAFRLVCVLILTGDQQVILIPLQLPVGLQVVTVILLLKKFYQERKKLSVATSTTISIYPKLTAVFQFGTALAI
jgi:alpha-N-acetylglucosamine transferase